MRCQRPSYCTGCESLFIYSSFPSIFFLPHSSHQVTINASQFILTLLHPISFLQLFHTRMTLALCFFFFLSTFGVSNTPKSTNLNNSCWLLYLTKKKLIIMKDMLIYEHIYYVGWTNGAVHPTLTWVLTIIFWYWELKLYICIFYAWVIKTIITINSTDQSLSLTLFSSRCQPLLTVFGS